METTRPLTETYLLELEAKGARFEVVNGKLAGLEQIEASGSGEKHIAISGELQALLYIHVKQNNLGKVYPADLIYVLSGEDTNIRVVRKPDVSFVKTENLKTGDRTKPYYRAPDLAIEIVSPSESAAETREKLNDYLAYGTTQVWIVYPRTQQIEVHLTDGTSKTYGYAATISGGKLLPGFTLNVSDIFDA